jgi:hypothetical protein
MGTSFASKELTLVQGTGPVPGTCSWSWELVPGHGNLFLVQGTGLIQRTCSWSWELVPGPGNWSNPENLFLVMGTYEHYHLQHELEALFQFLKNHYKALDCTESAVLRAGRSTVSYSDNLPVQFIPFRQVFLDCMATCTALTSRWLSKIMQNHGETLLARGPSLGPCFSSNSLFQRKISNLLPLFMLEQCLPNANFTEQLSQRGRYCRRLCKCQSREKCASRLRKLSKLSE